MTFAATQPDIGGILTGYGLAGVVIFALAVAVIAIARKLDRVQEQRIMDAKEFGNKIVEPLESVRVLSQRQSDLTEKMYEILLDNKRGR